MSENSKKITALLLMGVLAVVHVTLDWAHQHVTPVENHLTASAQPPGPKLQNGPPFCSACFFANHQPIIYRPLPFNIILAPLVVVHIITLLLFSQFQHLSCRNRAPPAGMAKFSL